jgi:hypothetical protein
MSGFWLNMAAMFLFFDRGSCFRTGPLTWEILRSSGGLQAQSDLRRMLRMEMESGRDLA